MKNKSVLIVDDNHLNRKLFENLIGQQYSYSSAQNGLEAVNLAKAQHFDLILMDIQMPLMDGITAMRLIKRETDHYCPIVAITAFAEERDRTGFLEQGFDEFVTKPIRPMELLQLVHRMLNNQTGTSSSSPWVNETNPLLDRSVINQLLKYHPPQTLRQILQDFLQECQETKALLDAPLEEDIDGLMKKIHTLKGNSGTLGAMGIYRSCAAAEALVKDKNTVDFSHELKNLKNEIRRFGDFLKQDPIFGT